MKILFLGNHRLGIESLRALRSNAQVVGVVAHPPDPEDGVCYPSLYDDAQKEGLAVIRSTGKNPDLFSWISQKTPDLIWVTDYRYLLPSEILQLAPLGGVNLHPSLLPKYRGRAPVNWAIIHGEKQLGLTAHFIDEGMDTGDIIEQVSFELTEEQDVGDALEKYYPLYFELTQKVLGYFLQGKVPRRIQNHEQASVYPRRKPEEGRIDWSQSALHIHRLIRAVARPYPGAFTFLNQKQLMVWSARVISESSSSVTKAGSVRQMSTAGIQVECGEGVIELTQVESKEEKSLSLKPGDLLGS